VYLFAISEARVWHNDASAVSGVGCWVFELFVRLCSGSPLSVCVFDCVHVCFLAVFAFLYDRGALVGSLAAGGGGVLMWSEDPNCEARESSKVVNAADTTTGTVDSTSLAGPVLGTLSVFEGVVLLVLIVSACLERQCCNKAVVLAQVRLQEVQANASAAELDAFCFAIVKRS
jgi:hypothetical protein